MKWYESIGVGLTIGPIVSVLFAVIMLPFALVGTSDPPEFRYELLLGAAAFVGVVMGVFAATHIGRR